ncbi:manganese efflux pump MntP family protein [Tumebacillus flagellatus]|uniref:Manganese efflux pump MntP n=1 Tax=Tumebacillus flagellatus TaxID=1157490 RepID=A0A074LFP6_9BACL|nr:manganese efflux pump [Tumebacillus flagellatus]KEO81066.1 hypothetical protein EL26_22780 [Tumebacillus flagellatus]
MHTFLYEHKELLELLLLAGTLGIDVFFVGATLGTGKLHIRTFKSFLFYVGLFHFLFSIVGILLGAYLHKLIGDLSELIGGLVIFTTGGYLWFGAWEKKKNQGSPTRHSPSMSMLAFGASLECLSIGLGVALHLHYILVIALVFTVAAVLASYIGFWSGRKMGGNAASAELIGAGCLTIVGLVFLLW